MTLLSSAALLGLGSAPAGAEEAASSADDWWEGTITYTLTAPGVTSESSHGTETQEYTFTVAGRIGTASASLKGSVAERDYLCHVGTPPRDVWSSEDVDLQGDLVGSFSVTQSGADKYTLSVPTVGVTGTKAFVKVVSGCTTESGTETMKYSIGPQDDLLLGTGNADTDDELSGSVESDACWPYAWLSTRRWLLEGCKRTVTWNLKRTKRDCNKNRRTGKQHASDAIKDYIKKKETFVPYLYNDLSRSYVKPWAKGNCTIGWGHKLHDGPCNLDCKTPSEADYVICEGSDWQGLKRITEQEEGKTLFDADLTGKDGAESKLNNRLKVPLNQDQFDALLDFVFNAGSLPDLSLWAGKSKQCPKYSPTNPRCQDVLFQINCEVFDNVYGTQGGKPVGLSKFNKSDGVYLQDLADRRAYEEKLWNTGGGNRPEGLAASTAHRALRSLPPPAKPLPNVGPPQARISITPGHVRAGKVVTVRGKHFGLRRHGCEPTVRLIAFVPAVSPYRAIELGRVDIAESRAFTRTWRTKKFVFRFRWAVVALQKCEGKTLQRRDSVLIR